MPREISIAFQTNKSPADYIALARYVNQYDFDAVSVYCDAPFHPSYGPLLLMAPHIQTARLGAAGVSPSRMHPIDMAANTALLAGVASGGVYLGIVRGAWLAEHGVTEVKRPVQAIRECIEVARYMLSGQPGGYDGEIYPIAEHVRATYPLPEKPIPVMIGTWGPKLCAVAGELADEVKIGGSANPDVIPVIQAYIADGERKAGRAAGSVGVVVGAVSVIDDDREQARMMARRAAVLYLPVVIPLDPTVEIAPDLIARLQQHANQQTFADGAKLISDDLLDKFAFAGNAADIIGQCERLFAAGASRVEFGTPHGLTDPARGITLLGEKVIPAVRAMTG